MINFNLEGGFGIVGNEFIMNYTISDEILSTYCIMRVFNFYAFHSCSVHTLQSIYDILACGSAGSQTKPIKDAITWLDSNKYIELYNTTGNQITFDSKYKGLFKVSFLYEDINNQFIHTGGFIIIPERNLIKLLQYIHEHKGIKKYQLIRYYLIIARQCANDSNFGYISQDKIYDITGISSNTCSEYNNILSSIGLIFYNNEYGHIARKGNIKMDCTMFGHVGMDSTMTDKKFNELVLDYVSNHKISKIDKVAANNKRSESMKKVWEDRKKTTGNMGINDE